MREHVLTVAERDISTDDRFLVRGTANEDTCRLVLDDEWLVKNGSEVEAIRALVA